MSPDSVRAATKFLIVIVPLVFGGFSTTLADEREPQVTPLGAEKSGKKKR